MKKFLISIGYVAVALAILVVVAAVFADESTVRSIGNSAVQWVCDMFNLPSWQPF